MQTPVHADKTSLISEAPHSIGQFRGLHAPCQKCGRNPPRNSFEGRPLCISYCLAENRTYPMQNVELYKTFDYKKFGRYVQRTLTTSARIWRRAATHATAKPKTNVPDPTPRDPDRSKSPKILTQTLIHFWSLNKCSIKSIRPSVKNMPRDLAIRT